MCDYIFEYLKPIPFGLALSIPRSYIMLISNLLDKFAKFNGIGGIRLVYLVCTIVVSIIFIFNIVKDRNFIWLCMFIPLLIHFLITQTQLFNFIIDPFKIWVILIIYIATYFTVFLYDFSKMKPEKSKEC